MVSDTFLGLGSSARVLRPGDDGYDEARRSFNGMVDRRPAVIVQPTTTDDVVAAVHAAREAGLPVAIRGGGHSVSGHAIAEGALVVDLRRMRAVTVDPERRLARAGGGALWEDVDGATVPHSLFVPGGTFVDTGIGGLTLTGGIGFLMGTGGLTCDNLVEATVVTADGTVVTASADGDPDLLWALRGGGGNFGVVTEFVFGLHPLREIHVGAYAVPLADAAAGLEVVASIQREAPPELLFTIVGPTTETGRPTMRNPWGRASSCGCSASTTGRSPRPKRPWRRCARSRTSAAGSCRSPTRISRRSAGSCRSACATTGRDTSSATWTPAPSPRSSRAWKQAIGQASFLLLEAITGRGRIEPEDGAAFGQRAARWMLRAGDLGGPGR